VTENKKRLGLGVNFFPSFAVVLFVSMSEKLIMTDFCLLSILGRTASINSFNVDSTSYIFYGLLFGSIIVTAIDNHRTYKCGGVGLVICH
jgi:hypothetical protein